MAPAVAHNTAAGTPSSEKIIPPRGLTAIALIDNLLYQVLVGNRLRAHTAVAFISILGDITVFGTSGIVLGPLVVRLTVFLLELWRRRTEGGRAAETVA